jgi:hypothetical protein
MPSAKVLPLDHFTKRSDHIISQAGLYQLVADMAKVCDQFPARFDAQDQKLDKIMELLNGRAST